MKNYKQFMKNMPNSSIVYAIEDWAIPNHETDATVKVAKKLAESNSCSYVIVVCNESILSLDTKMRYMNSLYPNVNFVESSNPVATIRELQEKYKTLIPLPHRIMESTNPISRMVSLAEAGNYAEFKKYLPSNLVDVNGKRLMNDVRQSLGYEAIREQIKFSTDSIREQYFSEEIFNVGDIVESNDIQYEILKRGTNHLILVDINGNTSRKWLQEVAMTTQTDLFSDSQFETPDNVPSEITFKGYTTKNLNRAPGANVAFAKTIKNVGGTDPLSVLNALKATDEYLSLTPEDILKGGEEKQQDLTDWSTAHLNAKRALDRCGEFINHIGYWSLYKNLLDKAVFAVKIENGSHTVTEDVKDASDKQRVAEIIRKIMGVDAQILNPEAIIDSALKKSISLDKDSMQVFNKMLKLADEVGIAYNKNLVPNKMSKLTTEQTILATERAEKYGRPFPNPIDVQWALKEGKAPPITIGKGEVGSSASLRPDDEKKLKIMNDPATAKRFVGEIDDKTKKEIEDYANTGDTTGIAPKDGVNQPEYTHVGASLTKDNDDTLARMKTKKLMNVEEAQCCKGEDEHDHEVEETDEEIDKMIDSLTFEDILDAYEDDEFSVVDAETGEEHKEEKPIKEESLMEVLTRAERLKARLRMAKIQSKLTAKRMLALKRHSDSKKINQRARHLAVNLLRKKLLRGRSFSTLAVSEKERIERLIEKKKKLISRMAMKLTSKIRKIENDRLSHKNYTKD